MRYIRSRIMTRGDDVISTDWAASEDTTFESSNAITKRPSGYLRLNTSTTQAGLSEIVKYTTYIQIDPKWTAETIEHRRAQLKCVTTEEVKPVVVPSIRHIYRRAIQECTSIDVDRFSTAVELDEYAAATLSERDQTRITGRIAELREMGNPDVNRSLSAITWYNSDIITPPTNSIFKELERAATMGEVKFTKVTLHTQNILVKKSYIRQHSLAEIQTSNDVLRLHATPQLEPVTITKWDLRGLLLGYKPSKHKTKEKTK